MVKIAILCGGVGSRLWPLSRKEKPKQFMTLPGSEYNLFQETILRIEHLEMECSELIIISNIEIKEEIIDSISNLLINYPITFIWEPIMRNTGPAIASLINYLCSENTLIKNDSDCIVWPSDHLLCMDTFNKSLNIANLYIKNSIITFGICPTYAETGYGYVIGSNNHMIEQFIEKPSSKIATELIENPNCYWNSGIFYFNSSIMYNEYLEKDPILFEMIQKSFKKIEKINGSIHIQLDKQYYFQCKEIPFDKLIMEKTEIGRIIPFNGKWSDIGSWDSISKLGIKTDLKNVIQIDNLNSHIYNYNNKQIVTTISLKNICIVNTSDALLIADISETQKVKNIYQILEKEQSLAVQKHRDNKYSWGSLEQLDSNSSSPQINKYIIKEKSMLVQKSHEHLLMYIIPINGNGVIIIDNVEFELKLNTQFYIPKKIPYKIINLSDHGEFSFISFQFM